MAKITSESIANLKALFQDNEKALGANFSQLIDFFNNNKVTDNGDGTFNVGAITVDASKLYDLINNSSPNILPLDNEFTGKNTFDIAPINKANGKPYITADSVPQPDLGNYATQQQLATKADDSKVVHLDDLLGGRNYLTNTSNPTTSNPIQFFGEVANIAGNVAYSNGGVTLTTATSGETYYRFNGANKRMPLQTGQTYTLSYTMSGTAGIYLATRILYAEDTVPTWENLTISYHACTTKSMNYKDTFTVPNTALSLVVSVQIYSDTNKNSDNTGTNSVSFSNVMLEKGEVQHDWVPAPEDIADNMASKSDVTTAINAATANMADTTKATNFTAGLQSGGVDVATAADLKSVADKAWRQLDNKYITAFTNYNTSIKVDENSLFLVKIDEVNKRVYMFFTILGNFVTNSRVYIDLTDIVKNVSFPSYHIYYLSATTESSSTEASLSGNLICFKIENKGTIVLSSEYSNYMVNAGGPYWTYSSCFVTYDELV